MAEANTVSLQTNFNVDPYYDDFDESKRFHRILFRPGRAVQARELTQIQTILQNQLDRFAEHIFKEGSTVRGLEMNYDTKISFIKIRDNDQNGNAVTPSTFVGSSVTGQTSGVTAIVYDSLDGSEAAAPNTKTLYLKYTNSGANNTTKAFLSGEVLVSNTALSANVLTGSASTISGFGSRITFGSGILYAKDHFINVDEQSLVLGRYSANTSYKVGFEITESVVTSGDDLTLLDPAQGSYNYTAPGADRLKLTATLVRNSVDSTNEANFVEKIRIKNGVPEYKFDKPLYSVINDYLARRTYDESGDYIVKGLEPRLREHLNDGVNQGVFTLAEGGDSTKLSVDIAPGKAYVQGYETERLVTNHVEIDKGNDFESVEALSVSANYGNYVVVDEVVGSWDINGHDRVDLYDTARNAISGGTFSASGPSGSKIGEARVRAIQYASGTKGSAAGQYNLYLYDINMTGGSFNEVRTIYFNNGLSDCFADPVLVGGSAVLNETAFNRSIFAIPANNIKTLRDSNGLIDNTYRFLKKFPVTISNSGTVTITTGLGDEQFPFSTGPLNNTQERENFHVVLTGSANTTSLGTASVTAGGNTFSLTGAVTKLNPGEKVKLVGYANTFTINTVNTNSFVTFENSNLTVSANLSKTFQAGQTISLNGVGGIAADRSVNINSTTSATIDIKETLGSTVTADVIVELNKVDGQEISKVLQTDRLVEINVSDSGTTVGPWNLGVSDGFALKEVRVKTGNTFFTSTSEGVDVTNSFELDNGMRDNFYDHSKLKLKTTASHTPANGNVYLVKLDYFTHDTSSGIGYFSVDSYPIDDVNTANTNAITTAEIPVYRSSVTGSSYDLRNHIDIRPRIVDTANNVTTLTNISRNPSTSTSIVEPVGGLRYMAPNENFTVDFDYYLPRKDRIVLTSTGSLRAIRGVPSLNPQTPSTPTDGMTLAIIDVAPYPSLPYENAKRVDRTDLACKVTPVRQLRYTMRDIGAIKNRVENLEYYTSLSLLEAETKSLFLADANGDDRFKNGILVDAFTGHNIGNVFNADYNISIDTRKNELRPPFRLNDVQLEFKSANSTNVTARSKDVTITVASGTYTVGETITAGAASGRLLYQVGAKLYLENISGTFVAGSSAVGGTSGTSSTISTVEVPNEGKLITLPYTSDVLIEQPFATSTRNAAGLFWSFKGDLVLNPDTDYWVDTVTQPEVQIDFDFNTQAWQNLANAWGTQFGDWNTIWTGVQETGDSIITSSGQTRTGLRADIGVPQTSTQSIGESVRDVNIIPFMRSREVQFTASGLKPSTRMYAYFDDTNVSAYCTPTDSSYVATGDEGDALITNASGQIFGIFRIPNETSLRFRTGTLVFKLSDSPTNVGSDAVTTFASAQYSASGLNQITQNTIIGTRNVNLEFTSVTESRTVTSVQRIERNWNNGRGNDENTTDGDGGPPDPIAQTFVVDFADNEGNAVSPGGYLTKLDLFFQSKDTTQPVIIEIREVDPTTSFITKKIVPFSRVIVPSASVNVSDTGAVPTPVVFETPVYLLNGTEYAIVVKPGAGNPNYTLWTARLGEDDLISGNRVVSQPYMGILFASANDLTWTPIQEEDLKFRMYFANFGVNQSGISVLKNVDREYFTIANTSGSFARIGEIVHGETTLTMTGSVSANVGLSVLGNTSSANGTVTFNSGSTIRLKSVTTDNKFTNGETVTVMFANGSPTGTTGTISSQSTPTGKIAFFDNSTSANTYLHVSDSVGSFSSNTWVRAQVSGADGKIQSIDNLSVDIFHTHLSKLSLQGTSVSVTGKFALTGSSLDTAFRNVNDNGDTEYSARRYVLSKSNETTNISGSKSAEFRVAFSNGANKRHSPAIDNDRAALFTVENLVNNDSTNEDAAFGGNTIAKYITRTVTLAEGQDAEDLKVYIDAYKPSTSEIKIYYKILNGEDGDTFDDRIWQEMEQITSANVVSDAENTRDFKEFEFGIPDANLTGSSGQVQYVNSNGVTYTGFKYFAVKVVLLSTSPSRVPRVKNFRSIALQI